MATHSDALRTAIQQQRAGRLAEAEQIYRQILRAEPNHLEALHLLGVIALQTGRCDDAIACIRQAIARDASQAGFHSNLGEAYRAVGRLDEAKACYEQALRLQPNFSEAHNNLALALTCLGDLSRAMHHFQRAIEIMPDNAHAHYNLSCGLLLQGDFARGWSEYAWRMRIPGHPSQTSRAPQWDGSPLENGRMFVFAEQGLGDTIQFIRYLPWVRSRVKDSVVQVAPRLIPILNQSGFDGLVPKGAPVPEHEIQSSLLSLPGLFRMTPAMIPADIPYLHPDPRLVEQWRAALSPIEGRKVGVVWQGSRTYYLDRYRSIPLAAFAPLADVPGVQLISLQQTDGLDQLESVADCFKVVQLAGELDSQGAFLDTAAIMKNLDLVISPDTAIAHLAGALGVPVWIALAITPGWRWLVGRSDSPWYPSVRLFRQSRFGQWSGVFQQMAQALADN